MSENSYVEKSRLLFEKNIAALASVDAPSAERIRKAQHQAYGIVYNPDNLPIPVKIVSGVASPISPYKTPLESAKITTGQMWTQIEKLEAPHIERFKSVLMNWPVLLGGMGCPYSIEMLMKREPVIHDAIQIRRRYLIVEQEEARVRPAFHCVDFSPYLLAGSLRFVVGADALEQLAAYLRAQTWHMVPLFPLLLTKEPWAKGLNKILNMEDQRRVSASKNSWDALIKINSDLDARGWAQLLRCQGARRPRVLIFTSRFTTFLQHCARNLFEAFESIGVEARLVMESHCTEHATGYAYFQTMEESPPDLAISFNSRRADVKVLVDNIPFCCWIQDPMPNLYEMDAGKEIGRRELVAIAFPATKGHMEERKYPSESLRILPIPTAPKLYRPVVVDDGQRKRYGARLSYVAHHLNSSEQELAMLIRSAPRIRRFFLNIYDLTRDRMESGKPMSFEELRSEFEKTPDAIPYITDFCRRVCRPLGQEVPLRWLIASGERDLKIFGQGWSASTEFGSYAAGEAKYGEELNLIYNATDINLNIHYWVTVHQRFFDCSASRGFQLITSLKDTADAIDRMLEGKVPVVAYKNRDDFLQKTTYYLDHPEERESNAQALHDYVIKNFTYEQAARNILHWSADLLEQE